MQHPIFKKTFHNFPVFIWGASCHDSSKLFDSSQKKWRMVTQGCILYSRWILRPKQSRSDYRTSPVVKWWKTLSNGWVFEQGLNTRLNSENSNVLNNHLNVSSVVKFNYFSSFMLSKTLKHAPVPCLTYTVYIIHEIPLFEASIVTGFMVYTLWIMYFLWTYCICQQ